ncbi:alpha/beta fold hydrolase [Nocardiopsis sp. CNT-189]|uniref:alpha/beta hydrolase family protein n=1 Tax=Nocardiopsis oceanisediminis TaxID=2816862 RepID=UPI003B2D4388
MRTLDVASADGVPLDAVLHSSKGDRSKGTVVQAHGITVDKDEGGMFVRLADTLSDKGFNVVRFSYRGHGKSGGTPRGVTVAGEMLDLQSVIEHALGAWHEPLSVLAASFGAVSSSLLLPVLGDRIDSLVLWNPVLDLEHTFLNPELPWGVENFSPGQQRELDTSGQLLIDGEFPLSPIMWREFSLYDPLGTYTSSRIPSLVVHGDQDGYVSYDIARAAASARAHTDFHTVQGSDHGFDSTEREDEAIRVSVDWLDTRARAVARMWAGKAR